MLCHSEFEVVSIIEMQNRAEFQTTDILKLGTEPAAWMGSLRGQHIHLHANTRSGQFAVLDREDHPGLWNTANTLST